MNSDDLAFMCREGFVQWLQAAAIQGQRLHFISKTEFPKLRTMSNIERRLCILQFHTEGTFMAIAANHVLEHLDWARELRVLGGVDCSALDNFDSSAVRDLRNMREHQIGYFTGKGHSNDRWIVETPDFRSDASSVVGTLLGGRLDYQSFATACGVTLQNVLSTS